MGTGNMGRIHARILSSLRSLVGVADVDLKRAKQVGEEFGVKAFDSFETMIEETSPDGVIIATPTPTHATIAKTVAEKYSHLRGIMIEKPLASTLEDARNVATILREKGIATLISHSEIYNPVVSRALSLISEGAIGTPRTIIHDRRGFVQPSRIPSLGDVFEDIGVHDFDIMTRISSGSAKLYAQCIQVDGICNAGTVMIKFDCGIEHFFHLSRQYVGRKRAMDVSGTKGTLVLDLFGQIIKVQDLDQEPYADSRTLRLPERGTTIKVYGEPVGEVLTDFLRCIETGETPRVSLDDGLAALEVVEAARKSVKTGNPIDISIRARK
ncbi:MAG: Gfo/Idh/MocA family oxidoreductase [Candidatus Thorarchaeota archaeon]